MTERQGACLQSRITAIQIRPPAPTMAKVFIIHSMGMSDEALEHARQLELQLHETYVPCRDTAQEPGPDDPEDFEKVILAKNLEGIKWADEVHLIWDLSSMGSMFDLGSAYALGKPIYVVQVKKHHWTRFVVRKAGERLL